jgi:hypothetical protein
MNGGTIKFVRLSNRRTIELSDYRTVGLSTHRTVGLSIGSLAYSAVLTKERNRSRFTDTICPICRANIVGNPQPIALHPSGMISWTPLKRARTYNVICCGFHDAFSANRSNHHNLDRVHVYDKALATWRIHWNVTMTTITSCIAWATLLGSVGLVFSEAIDLSSAI